MCHQTTGTTGLRYFGKGLNYVLFFGDPAARKLLRQFVAILALALCLSGNASAKHHKDKKENDLSKGTPVLWTDPGDISKRDLFYGAGGKDDQPAPGPIEFLKEDTKGTSPKFDAQDSKDTKWKVKSGDEARPETVATRLLWAVGYNTDEDYFLHTVAVQGLPEALVRGQKYVHPAGVVNDVRLKRRSGIKKMGSWKWKNNPFSGTRELNGLRVMMALLNNWDVKDENNSIYVEKDHPGKLIYLASDVGASFGSANIPFILNGNKGHLKFYRHSRFITKTTASYVDFACPGYPPLPLVFALPAYIHRFQLRWIGHRIPRADAHWLGELLSRLSDQQLRDAFRAGGYSPQEINGFVPIVEARITKLKDL